MGIENLCVNKSTSMQGPSKGIQGTRQPSQGPSTMAGILVPRQKKKLRRRRGKEWGVGEWQRGRKACGRGTGCPKTRRGRLVDQNLAQVGHRQSGKSRLFKEILAPSG